MISGRHTHYCERCQKDKECQQITHCRRPATWMCLDCRAEEFSKHESGERTDEERHNDIKDRLERFWKETR